MSLAWQRGGVAAAIVGAPEWLRRPPMLDVTPTPLQRLLRERRRGYSLPAAFYLSPEVFQADMDVIFGRHWIYVGVEPDVPEAGDVMVVDIGTTSVAGPWWASSNNETPSDGSRFSSTVWAPLLRASATKPAAG